MKIYAIIDKETNIVLNIIHVENEKFIFLDPEKEYFCLANRAVQIGMFYDKNSGKFPETGDQGELLDLRFEINLMIKNHNDLISKNTHLTTEQIEIHLNYINQLRKISLESSYVNMKSQFDALGNPPEFPSAPKVITQKVFRKVLKLTEKILWDNPETGTAQQTAVINTLKMEFPYYGVESMSEELSLLESIDFFTSVRVSEVTQALS